MSDTRHPGESRELGEDENGRVSPAPRGPSLRRDDAIGRPHSRVLGFAIAGAVFLFDQLVKWLVINPLELQQRGLVPLLKNFDLRWVENRGVSMGFLTADTDLSRWLLVLFTAAIAAFVGSWLWRERRRDDSIALALVLGGALGNILDRIRFGYVVDYADLHFGEWRPFLIFNVADAAITIGVLLLLLRTLLTRDGKKARKDK